MITSHSHRRCRPNGSPDGWPTSTVVRGESWIFLPSLDTGRKSAVEGLGYVLRAGAPGSSRLRNAP